MTKTAFLRVYSPDASTSQDPVPRFVRAYGLLSEPDGDHLTAEWRGRRLICPQNLRLRVLESTVAFANAFRGLGSGLVPVEAARAADRELRSYHAENPNHRSHILTSVWHVPVRWFTAFDPEEKEVYEGRAGPRLRFRTELADARRRVRRAYDILNKLEVFQGPAAELGHLLEWLEPFSDDSMLELDYAGVSELFDSQDLVLDDSCDLVQESVDALDAGDMLRAGECYGKVVSRWAPAFSVTFSN